MKSKLLTLCFVTLLSVFILGNVSADLSSNQTSLDHSMQQGEKYIASFAITNDDTSENVTDLTYDFSSFVSGSYALAKTNFELNGLPDDGQLDSNESADLILTLNVPSNQEPGEYDGTLTIKGNSSSGEQTFTLPITITVEESVADWEDNFCIWDGDDYTRNVTRTSDLEIRHIDFSVEGYGDDNEWVPLDQIEVEVEVENRNRDYDVDNIEIEWGLYDTRQGEWVIDVDREDEIDLRDDESDTITFSFTIDDSDLDIDLEDLSDGSHYVLYARATGELDNDDQDDTCGWDSEDVRMIIPRDFVALKNIEVPDSVSCDQTFPVSADVWNIGDRDQDDVTVLVTVDDFDFAQEYDFDEIRSLDKENLEFTIPVPSDASEGRHIITFQVLDEDRNLFKEDLVDDDEESQFSPSVSVKGNCGGSSGGVGKAIVSANIRSGGEAGEPLVLDVSVENTGDDRATFLLNAAGYAEWANAVDLSDTTLTLDSGDMQKITFTFDVKDDVSAGDKSFDVEVISGNELVLSQPVSVYIEGKSTTNPFGDNWYLWLIGALNVILVVVIIVVAVRVARK